ncbi:MAG: hypothetical protein ACXWTW_10540 [Methylobacter sp.]
MVKVPYCLRVSEEVKIYKKLLENSSLYDSPCAPGTLKMMAQFAVLSKLNTLDRILKAKRVDRPVMPSSTPA